MNVSHCLAGLKPIRRVRRVPVAALAELIAVSPASYSRFERGERRLYFDKACLLAERLGVRLDDFTNLIDEIDASRICSERDEEARFAGRLNVALLTPGAPSSGVPVPPPPPPPPPEVNARADDAGVEALLGPDWSDE